VPTHAQRYAYSVATADAATFSTDYEEVIMGELKDLRAQQENLVNRARELGNKLYMAGLGAVSKAETTSNELLDEYVARGTAEFGEAAEGKHKAILASRGALLAARELIETAPEKRKALYERFVDAGRSQRGEDTNEFILAGLGAVQTAREESEKLFNELVSAGEQRA
jgi:polyhydroxyalkanoate synthesis regulator phasin